MPSARCPGGRKLNPSSLQTKEIFRADLLACHQSGKQTDEEVAMIQRRSPMSGGGSGEGG